MSIRIPSRGVQRLNHVEWEFTSAAVASSAAGNNGGSGLNNLTCYARASELRRRSLVRDGNFPSSNNTHNARILRLALKFLF